MENIEQLIKQITDIGDKRHEMSDKLKDFHENMLREDEEYNALQNQYDIAREKINEIYAAREARRLELEDSSEELQDLIRKYNEIHEQFAAVRDTFIKYRNNKIYD